MPSRFLYRHGTGAVAQPSGEIADWRGIAQPQIRSRNLQIRREGPGDWRRESLGREGAVGILQRTRDELGEPSGIERLDREIARQHLRVIAAQRKAPGDILLQRLAGQRRHDKGIRLDVERCSDGKRQSAPHVRKAIAGHQRERLDILAVEQHLVLPFEEVCRRQVARALCVEPGRRGLCIHDDLRGICPRPRDLDGSGTMIAVQHRKKPEPRLPHEGGVVVILGIHLDVEIGPRRQRNILPLKLERELRAVRCSLHGGRDGEIARFG